MKNIIYVSIFLFVFKLSYAENYLKDFDNIKSFYMDFDEAMDKGSIHYLKKYDNNLFNKDYLQKLKNLYEQNNINKIIPQKEYKIQKNIHQIWIGGKKLPSIYKKLQKTWKLKHPDWNYILWTDEKVKKLKLINQVYYDESKDIIEKANILRYEILYQYGGLYVDIDMECLKSFDLFHHCYEFYAGIEHNFCPPILNNAVIGCSRGNSIIFHCIESIKNDWKKPTRIERTGVYHFSHCLKKMLNDSTLKVIFPMNYFYPLVPGFATVNKIEDLYNTIDKIKTSKSFAIHYYKSGASLQQISYMHEQLSS